VFAGLQTSRSPQRNSRKPSTTIRIRFMSNKSKTLTIDLNALVSHGVTVGFEVPANTTVNVIGLQMEETSDDIFPFHLLSACLGPNAVANERALLTFGPNSAVCASLTVGTSSENVLLDMQFSGDFQLGNKNAQGTSIHVVGRLLLDDEDDEDYVPGDDMFADEDEEVESDEEEDYVQSNTSSVVIEQLPDDEEEEQVPVAKKAKVMAADKASASVASKATDKPSAASASKPTKAANPSAAATASDKPKAAPKQSEVLSFVKALFKTNASLKSSDIGSKVSAHFGIAFKKMGFEEKSLSKVLSQDGDFKVMGEDVSLKKI
jgi:hypothetical protein